MSMFGDTVTNPVGHPGGGNPMSGFNVKPSVPEPGLMVVQDDTVIKGKILNCRVMEVYGLIEGEIEADRLIVHSGGKIYGTIKVDSAEIDGTAQGRIYVKNLISIKSEGTVIGNVQYGQLAMETGADLSADVRNVPPTLSGDFNITVEKGKSAPVTTWDVTAFDPDDDAKDLTFTVSNPVGGFVALASMPSQAASKFTQADLEAGKVMFKHNGNDTNQASFSVVVNDAKGGSSGKAQTVTVDVKA